MLYCAALETDFSQTPAPAPAAQFPLQPSQPLWPRLVTGLAALVLAGGILMLAGLVLSTPRLQRVADPDRALSLIVNRTMDLDYAIAQTPLWEHLFYEATTGWADDQAQAIEWYEELAVESGKPLSQAYLAILEGEAGRIDLVEDKIAGWTQLPDPFPVYARLLGAAYLHDDTLAPDEARALRDELESTIPLGWFGDRLALSLATRAGNQKWLTEVQGGLAERSDRLLVRARLLLGLDLGLILLGVALLGWVLARAHSREETWGVGEAMMPPPWPGSAGATVLIRGGALWIGLLLSILSIGPPSFRLFAMPLTYLPLLLLARRDLMEPAGLGLRAGVGWIPRRGRWGRCWRLVAIVSATGLLVEWLVTMITQPMGLGSHWTEGFDEALVWGDGMELATSLVETIVFAPVFEEIVFRGLFFATLRRRFGFVASALISASVFAVAHGYGVLGFISVLWSGLLWAWVYERSGSILPGILAHMVNNASVCLSIILMLR